MKHFFTNESIYDLVYEKQTHTQRILNGIHTSINFNSQIIEIDRTIEINELENQFKNHQVLILCGAGGVGKTAIVKKLYEKIKNEVPVYLFKASEFETNQIDNLFGNDSLQKFVDIHERDKEKVIIIDSAEKILDINNRDSFKEFVITLLAHKWNILFTTRYSYLDDLNYHLLEMLNIIPYRVDIQNFSNEALSGLEKGYDFNLPVDEKLFELLKNPFYLNEYLAQYTNEKINYQDFKNKLWNQTIKKTNPQREQCFLKLVSTRAKEGQFYINLECLSNSLEEFRKEGLLGYETAGYFITHDIYEEWALNKIIEIAFIKRTNEYDFFVQIGSSLPIRRAFRGWISDKLLLNDDSIKSFLENIVDEPNIESYWKDEIFVAILLSEYSDTFFQNFDRELQANNYELLERISFLIRIACKEIDDSIWKQLGLNSQTISEAKYIFTQPKENGWKSFITFIYEHIETIKLQKINIILPVLHDWNSKFREGETTRKASLIALKYYDWIHEDGYYRHNENIKKIFNVIINGSSEIKNELEIIFNEVIENNLTNHSDKYYELSETILSKLEGLPISKSLPAYVHFSELTNDIKILLLFHLFDDYQIGMGGKHFYDFAIEAIGTYFNREINSFIAAYLLFKPKYDELMKTNYYGQKRVAKQELVENFLQSNEEIVEKFSSDELKLSNNEIKTAELDILIVAFKMIVASQSTINKDFTQKIIEILCKNIFNKTDDKVDYDVKQQFVDSLALFILQVDKDDIMFYLQPLFEQLKPGIKTIVVENDRDLLDSIFKIKIIDLEESTNFLIQLIYTQDAINNYDNFWYLWECFEDNIITICKNGDMYRDVDQILKAYLLARGKYANLWNDTAKEWHSLKDKDIRFLKKLTIKIGHCPSALYAVSKLLTGIGSAYINDGISWIAEMLRNNSNLSTDELEADTIFHLENLIRKYIFLNTEKIKKEKNTKEDILIILNFLIEKGSSLGYMLRERIL